MNLKKITSGAMALAMVASMAACGSKAETPATPAETPSTPAETTPADDPNRPAAVSPEDWEAMKKEPVFGKEINYLFNGGACVSAKYQAEAYGYYQEYGINATFLKGGSVVNTVGTGQAMWGTDHIATMLVPVAKGVNMTFVTGAHTGCKSLYTLNETGIKTVEDLKGKRIAIHDGLGESDMNIGYRLLDEFGIDPTKDVEWVVIEGSATSTQAMMNGEVDAAVYSDYYVAANGFADKMTNIVSLTFTEEFMDEPCCVTAMNNDFIKENPVHAKYVVKAIKRAGETARLHSDEAVQMMFDNNMMTGEYDNQKTFWDTLYFGLSDAFTKRALEEIIADYLRLGMFPTDITTDNAEELLNLAWTPVCPDEEMGSDYTVGDPVVPANAIVPQKQYSVNGPKSPVAPASYVAPTYTNAMDSASSDTPVADKEVSLTVSALSAAEIEAMKSEPMYDDTIIYWYGGGNCTSAPYIAEVLGLYEQYGIKSEVLSGAAIKESLGTNAAQIGVSHIASLLVPITNGVNYSFVAGAHAGCQSLFVLADSPYQTTADLIGKKISVPNGIGNSSYNITARWLDADGIDPLKDVEMIQVETDACIAAMESGEIAAVCTGDTWGYDMVKSGKLRVIRSLLDPDFAQEPCCVIAMNNDFIKENPNMAKAMTECIKIAGDWMRQNPEEAVQILLDANQLSGAFEKNLELWNTLQFGLTDEATGAALEQIIDDYIRLGLIPEGNMTQEEMLAAAWNPQLSDSNLGYETYAIDGSWWD